MHLALQEWVYSPFGLVALLGVSFACGLPCWALVRMLFNYVRRHRDADLLQVVREVKELL